jgi:predicted DNA-binding mobile mystery protein A
MKRGRLPPLAEIRELDERLKPLRELGAFDVPKPGWVREVRTALGVSAAEFGRLMGISRQAVADLERREERGAVTVASLRRAAEVLGCDLTYAIVPRKSLKKLRKARERAAEAQPARKSDAVAVQPESRALPEAESVEEAPTPVDQLARDLLRRSLLHAWDDIPRDGPSGHPSPPSTRSTR